VSRGKTSKSGWSENEFQQVCDACNLCEGDQCFALAKEMSHEYNLPKELKQTYGGHRFTADAMDCALPIALDSHSGCSYSCVYCFSNNLQRAPDRNKTKIQQIINDGTFYTEWPIRKLEAFLARDLKDKTSLAMYPLMDTGCPVQMGALGDPFDDIEIHTGWMKKAIPLFIKYKVPMRISTKGAKALLEIREYRKALEKNPEQFWFAFSTISNSDDLIAKVDIGAPVTSERLKAMKLVTDIGCRASLRFRPFLPGISDAYKGEPNAWAKLMERSREAGAMAVSFEYIFIDNAPTQRQKAMYRLMFSAMNRPNFLKEWFDMSHVSEKCRRGARSYKAEMTFNIRDKAHELGMIFGCSDPHFKEYNDTGCCCGMPEEDTWFGNWSRKQTCEVLVQAKRAHDNGQELLFNYNDWKPEWAHQVKLAAISSSLGSWHTHRVKKHVTFGAQLRQRWNNPKHPRGPYIYFGGVLEPVGIDDNTNDVVYKYRKWTPELDLKFKTVHKLGNSGEKEVV